MIKGCSTDRAPGILENRQNPLSRVLGTQAELGTCEPCQHEPFRREYAGLTEVQNARPPDDPRHHERLRRRTRSNSRGHQPGQAALDEGRHSRLRPGLDRHRRRTTTIYVTVRGGDVRKVESVQADGRRFVLNPSDTRFYSVDGLFLTIADELAQLKTDHPFGQPQGTKVVMRFKPDPKLGYPQWYRRDVMGTTQAIAIDVVKLVPVASTAK